MVTTNTDVPEFSAAVYRGRGRLVPPDEAFSESAPHSLVRARSAGEEGAPGRDMGSEARNRMSHAAERTRDGIRVVYEVVPHEAGLLEELRLDRAAKDRL